MNILRAEQAVQYIKSTARPLEQAIYRHLFEEGEADEVVSALAEYQNADGGFGHGLEPDLQTPLSSALTTTNALAILSDLPQSEGLLEMVHRGLSYLADTYNEACGGWEIIPEGAEASPRAVWWKYGSFDAFWGNPNAEIAAYFLAFQQTYPYAGAASLVRRAIDYLLHTSELTEMHEMLCYLRLYERLDAQQQAELASQIERFLDNCVIQDGSEGYGARPLQIADTPESQYYSKYEGLIPAELDALIAAQGEDGAWLPNWDWHQYPEHWPAAREAWKGILTLNALRTLRAYHRLP
ncbi:hypothetical protein [Paenibacillus sp. 598K]|uniref:hypothetical protein n=1 Tax=Paenibacillus sp. 598K TaxID=1117987 RepID=UPI00162A1E2C|nr:hypothetical protein [Paenibacillus sp. 598K]